METSRKFASRAEFEFPKASFYLDFASSSRVELREKVWFWVGISNFIGIVFGRALIFKKKSQKQTYFKDFCFSNTFFAKMMCFFGKKRYSLPIFIHFGELKCELRARASWGKTLASLRVREFESSSFPSLFLIGKPQLWSCELVRDGNFECKLVSWQFWAQLGSRTRPYKRKYHQYLCCLKSNNTDVASRIIVPNIPKNVTTALGSSLVKNVL